VLAATAVNLAQAAWPSSDADVALH
jgi:hypothetical protein